MSSDQHVNRILDALISAEKIDSVSASVQVVDLKAVLKEITRSRSLLFATAMHLKAVRAYFDSDFFQDNFDNQLNHISVTLGSAKNSARLTVSNIKELSDFYDHLIKVLTEEL